MRYVPDGPLGVLWACFSAGVLIFFPFLLEIAALFLQHRSFITPALRSSLCFSCLAVFPLLWCCQMWADETESPMK